MDNISDPKLELKQPKIEGYFRKSAEINVKTKPILPDIEALDYSEILWILIIELIFAILITI